MLSVEKAQKQYLKDRIQKVLHMGEWQTNFHSPKHLVSLKCLLHQSSHRHGQIVWMITQVIQIIFKESMIYKQWYHILGPCWNLSIILVPFLNGLCKHSVLRIIRLWVKQIFTLFLPVLCMSLLIFQGSAESVSVSPSIKAILLACCPVILGLLFSGAQVNNSGMYVSRF